MTYFKLALELAREYVKANIADEVSTTVSTEKHEQWTAGGVSVILTEVADDQTLINFVKGLKTETVTVDWNAFDVSSLEKVTPELHVRFSAYMDHKLGNRGDFVPRQNERQLQELRGEENVLVPALGRGEPISAPNSKKPSDMPDFDDDYEVKNSGRTAMGIPAAFPAIGDRDLNPPGLPKNPAMKPYIDPLALDPDGGMYPSSSHPLFGGRTGNTSRLGVPPGARFDDPYGEDNLEDMGMGLPGNLRRGLGNDSSSGPGFGSGFGGPGFGGPGFGGSGFGGSGSGGFGF